MKNAPLPNLGCEHRPETVPPEPHRLMADIDTTFEQQVLDLTKRSRMSDVHQYRKADYLGGTIERTKGILHPPKLPTPPFRLKPN
jgi:hypothetical protein